MSREELRLMVPAAEQCLVDNGIDADEASIVLQAIGFILLGLDLYEEV